MKFKHHKEQPEKDGFTEKQGLQKILGLITVAVLVICMLVSVSGCDTIRQGLLERIERQPAEEPGKDAASAEGEATEAADDEATGTEEEAASTEDLKTGDAETKASSDADTMVPTGPADLEQSSGSGPGIDDLEIQREYFKKGIEFFEDQNYIIAEYYFNQVRDSYRVLQDHVLYYYAKSLLMQEKYEKSGEIYQELKTDFPDSIFGEKANLEYADLFYIEQNYTDAETAYKGFIEKFPKSELITYTRYQLAVCQQRNDNPVEAAKNYRTIWLEHPESDYAGDAYAAIEAMAEEGVVEEFVPTSGQIYQRGEIFFELYRYENALQEFDQILEGADTGPLDATLHAKTLFKKGMCYYNMRDYSTSRDYLSSSYSRFPSSSYADDSLYFMGRAYTNLDQDSTAIKKYEELLSKFTGSNYADDALFRIGRIYLFDDDLKNAEKYFQRIVDEYPGGDRVKEIYWALGWIQYKNGDYSAARNTFSDMAGRYGKNQLGEQGLFWKAKCSEKLGEEGQAIESYKRIVDYDSFSYYTFAARSALERLGRAVELKEINTEVYPDNPDIAEILPDIFGETGTVKEASEPGADSEGTGVQGTEQVAEYGHIDKAKELLVIELFESAAKEIEAASPEIADNSTGILEISTLYLEAKDYISSQKIITKNLTKLRDNLSGPYEDYLYYLLYPYGYKEYVDRYSAEYDVDPLYILAIIREESRFQPDAGSFAGALGLMQIMPATGKSIASSLGISGFDNEMLFDTEKNIRMGTYYIRAQLDNFNQNKYHACGAYNGGPGAMSRWLSKYSDKDIDEFIENITFDETRKYVKKVMGSYFFYQILYGS